MPGESTHIDNEQRNIFRGFIRRHWNGDFSLGVSYWVVGALLGVAITIFVTLVGDAEILKGQGPKLAAAFIFLLYVFVLSFAVWQFVGIWRSADKHVSRGGRSIWAGLAKVMVVLGLLRVSADMVNTGFPLMAESIRLLAGVSQVAQNEIRLLRDGTELELAGGIDQGTTASVRKFLDASPAIRVIHLNSEGGWIAEAVKLKELIQERGLITYTSSQCASACVIAYLGGSERYIGETGRLGFHSASYGSLGARSEISEQLNKDLRDILTRANVPQRFIARAIGTDAKDIWYPTHDELVAAHIVDSVVDTSMFGLSGIKQWRDAQQLEKEILEVPPYAALAQYDPTNYTRIKNVLIDGLQHGRSESEINNSARKILIDELLPVYLRIAPDAELVRYWRTQIDEMLYLSKIDAKHCADFAFPEFAQAPVDLSRLLPQALLAEDLSALAQLIASAATYPVKGTSNQGERDLEYVISNLGSIDPDALAVIAKSDRYKDDPEALCVSSLLLYQQILALPNDNRSGAVLRYMFSQ